MAREQEKELERSITGELAGVFRKESTEELANELGRESARGCAEEPGKDHADDRERRLSPRRRGGVSPQIAARR